MKSGGYKIRPTKFGIILNGKIFYAVMSFSKLNNSEFRIPHSEF